MDSSCEISDEGQNDATLTEGGRQFRGNKSKKRGIRRFERMRGTVRNTEKVDKPYNYWR